MSNNKPATPGEAFGRSTKPYAPGEKPGVNATQPGPDMESVATPRNTQVDPVTKPDPVTGGATTEVGKRAQPLGAPNKGRDGMRADPLPNPHIPQSTEVKLAGIPDKPSQSEMFEVDPLAEEAADKIAAQDEKEPHPEHVAGKVAIKHFEAKTNAEVDLGKKHVSKAKPK